MRRFLPGDLNRLTIRCNTPVQGSGAAILKVALASLWAAVRQAGPEEVRIAAAVHDQIVLLVREDRAQHWCTRLKEIMENAESIWLGDVPAVAEAKIGHTWAESH